MTETIAGAVKARLNKASKVIVASHVRPDGDAIGSLLGLGLALQDAGKSVQMVLVDGVPSSFKHLEGSDVLSWEVVYVRGICATHPHCARHLRRRIGWRTTEGQASVTICSLSTWRSAPSPEL